MSHTVEQIIEQVGELVSLPEVCVKVNALINDPNSSIADVAKVIAQDPGLTARMLRIANSAFYGLVSKVDSVDRAAAIIGMAKIRDLVLATSVAKTLPNDVFTMDAFWKHSIFSGLAAKALATHSGRGEADALFVGGLLHDIGQLVMFHVIREETSDALMASIEEPDEPPLYEVERRMIGFDHCQMGVALARKWQLPDLLCDCIEFHHQPGRAERHQDEVAIVHVANSLAYLAEIRSEDFEDAPPISPAARELLGLSDEKLLMIVAVAQREFSEVNSLLFGSA
jgi:putative nucleotidyltransferase with HDIG domain